MLLKTRVVSRHGSKEFREVRTDNMRAQKSTLPIIVAFIFCSTVLWAQTGSISGNVTDSTGALIQGAEVTVRNLETSQSRTTVTSDKGAYRIAELPVGKYEITVTQANFKTFRVEEAALNVAQVLTINAALEIGSQSEAVEVRANQTPDIDLESAQVSNLVDQRRIQDLPLITRDPYSLVLLSPGTFLTESSNGGFSVNGARDRKNNILM